MKLAVMTDIHGNLPALRAVLRQIDAAGDIGRICCLGDMIGIGPDTNEVLGVLTERNDVFYTVGNHERAVLHIANGKGCLPGHETAYSHHQWIAERLDPVYLPFLQSLPDRIEAEEEDCSLFMAHYHLQADGEFVPIDSSPNGEKLDAMYAGTDFDVVCFGHHHPVHLFRTERRTYLNPGSLGCHHQPLARYGMIRTNGGEAIVELKEASYDNRAFLQSYFDLEVPDRDFIVNVFHGNQQI